MASDPSDCVSNVSKVDPRRQVVSVSKGVTQEAEGPIRLHVEHVFGSTPRKAASRHNPQIKGSLQCLKIERVVWWTL